jgi:hypothetical protein
MDRFEAMSLLISSVEAGSFLEYAAPRLRKILSEDQKKL